MSLVTLVSSFEKYLDRKNPWQNTYGIARSLLAFGTLSSLLFNNPDYLFRPAPGIDTVPICRGYNFFSLFCIIGNLNIAVILAIIGLIIVIIGFRPRFTGILHWYITYSYTTSATLLDGGDHITTILTLLLLPLCLTDRRKWHWNSPQNFQNVSERLKKLLAISTIVVIQIQVSLIYLNSATAKLSVPEWVDGTAIYYWFSHPTFGAPYWIQWLTNPLISNEYTVTFISWSVIIFEFLLFAGIIAKSSHKKVLLLLGILFHFGIIVVHGLFSFFFAMTGALILFLGPMYTFIKFDSIKIKSN